MTLSIQELKQIAESLKECDPDVEYFSFAPSLEYARRRKDAALKLLKKEIKELQNVRDANYNNPQ